MWYSNVNITALRKNAELGYQNYLTKQKALPEMRSYEDTFGSGKDMQSDLLIPITECQIRVKETIDAKHDKLINTIKGQAV